MNEHAYYKNEKQQQRKQKTFWTTKKGKKLKSSKKKRENRFNFTLRAFHESFPWIKYSVGINCKSQLPATILLICITCSANIWFNCNKCSRCFFSALIWLGGRVVESYVGLIFQGLFCAYKNTWGCVSRVNFFWKWNSSKAPIDRIQTFQWELSSRTFPHNPSVRRLNSVDWLLFLSDSLTFVVFSDSIFLIASTFSCRRFFSSGDNSGGWLKQNNNFNELVLSVIRSIWFARSKKEGSAFDKSARFIHSLNFFHTFWRLL